MLPRVLRLTLNSNGYWLSVQTKDPNRGSLPRRPGIQAFSAQSTSLLEGLANANKAKATAINDIALRANDQ